MRKQYPDAEIVKEIGSAINFKRRILGRAMCGDIITLVVAYKERLARFGADIIEFILNQNGGKLVVLNEVSLSSEEELTRDLHTILYVFSCRLHGLRKYKYEISQDTNLSDIKTETNSQTMAGDFEICLQQND